METGKGTPLKDFFISYNKADRTWAEWIAWHLTQAGYSVLIQAWDFRPGANFVLEMDQAVKTTRQTIAVLSPEYLDAFYTQTEWADALRRGPTGAERVLVPVRVRECTPSGLLATIVYLDLVGLEQDAARERLLAGLRESGRPTTEPAFPQDPQQRSARPSPLPQPGGAVFPPVQGRSARQEGLPRGGASPSVPEGGFPQHWLVPYRHNPYFLTHKQALARLHRGFGPSPSSVPAPIQAITGLGGMGKTQLATEYAFSYRSSYPGGVFWVRADSHAALLADFLVLAEQVEALPSAPTSQEPDQLINAVTTWFRHHGEWLLVLDNADNLALASPFLPTAYQGHILLTSRVVATGAIAQGVALGKLTGEEGARFLLARSKLVPIGTPPRQVPEAQRTRANDIAEQLDGLPLALDQAGAYIEETACGLSGFLEIYRTHQVQVLQERGGVAPEYATPVATTWALAKVAVQQTNPAAADLLRFCAFLYPEAIPEIVLTRGALELGPTLSPVASDPFLLNEALRALLRFSLLQRDPEARTLTFHRMVQTTVRNDLPEDQQRLWAERVVRAIHRAFPRLESGTGSNGQLLLPQLEVCASLIEQWGLTFPEASDLLHRTSRYLTVLGQADQASTFESQAKDIESRH